MYRFFICFCIFFLIGCNSGNSDLFAIAYNPEVDITEHSKVIQIGNISVKLDSTRPLRSFEKLNFFVTFIKDNKHIDVENSSIKFNMKMDMGRVHYRLKKVFNKYIAESVIIPKCITPDKRWYAKVNFKYHNKDYFVIFIFDIDNP
jgi:archaellin